VSGYLDPPSNSNADYNVLFSDQEGVLSAAQVKAKDADICIGFQLDLLFT
jgi:hypothetical protein